MRPGPAKQYERTSHYAYLKRSNPLRFAPNRLSLFLIDETSQPNLVECDPSRAKPLVSCHSN
jgi:hypothetical protein